MIELAFTALLVVLGFFIGGYRERRHYEDLKAREMRLLSLVPARTDRGPKIQEAETFLVATSVVVAADYFKTFVGNLRNFFGGRLSTHETLLDRARREALCRLRQKAFQKGATEIVELRLETSFIDQMGVEVTSYGTAVKRPN